MVCHDCGAEEKVLLSVVSDDADVTCVFVYLSETCSWVPLSPFTFYSTPSSMCLCDMVKRNLLASHSSYREQNRERVKN